MTDNEDEIVHQNQYNAPAQPVAKLPRLECALCGFEGVAPMVSLESGRPQCKHKIPCRRRRRIAGRELDQLREE